jgi:hypothetical protein
MAVDYSRSQRGHNRNQKSLCHIALLWLPLLLVVAKLERHVLLLI